MAEEKRLQDKILDDLRSYQKWVVAFKIQKTSDNGIPDIFFTSLPTGPILVELKAEGEELEPLQKFLFVKLNQCGTPTYYCDSWETWVTLKYIVGLIPSNFPQ